MEEASHSWILALSVVDSVSLMSAHGIHPMSDVFSHSCVLILSKGVTANSDSVAPAKKPAMTVAGPDTVPSAAASIDLYWSNATNPRVGSASE